MKGGGQGHDYIIKGGRSKFHISDYVICERFLVRNDTSNISSFLFFIISHVKMILPEIAIQASLYLFNSLGINAIACISQ